MCFIDRMIQQRGGVVRCPECDSVVQDHRICPNCIANARSGKKPNKPAAKDKK